MSPEDIVASIFRKFKQSNLTPDFIREESNRICEALNIPRIGDPGRVARLFAEQGLVKKDNPLKANYYFYEQTKNSSLDFYTNAYYLPSFSQSIYEAYDVLKQTKEAIRKNHKCLNDLLELLNKYKTSGVTNAKRK